LPPLLGLPDGRQHQRVGVVTVGDEVTAQCLSRLLKFAADRYSLASRSMSVRITSARWGSAHETRGWLAIRVGDLGNAQLEPCRVLAHGPFQRLGLQRQGSTALRLRRDPDVAAKPRLTGLLLFWVRAVKGEHEVVCTSLRPPRTVEVVPDRYRVAGLGELFEEFDGGFFFAAYDLDCLQRDVV